MLTTVPKFGYLYQASLLSLYFVFTVSANSFLGLRLIRNSYADSDSG